MDDMLLFGRSKQGLGSLLSSIELFLRDRLKLRLKAEATVLAPVSEGIPFLGFRIFPGLVRIQGKTLRRFRRRLKIMERLYAREEIKIEHLALSVQSMIAHISHANTKRLRQSLLAATMPPG